MSKLILVVLGMVAMVFLAGCAEKPASTPPAPEEAATTAESPEAMPMEGSEMEPMEVPEAMPMEGSEMEPTEGSEAMPMEGSEMKPMEGSEAK